MAHAQAVGEGEEDNMTWKDRLIRQLGGMTAADAIERWRATGGTSYSSSRTFIGDVDDKTRLFLSLYEPVVYWIVTRVAQDVFNDWFTVIDVSNEDDMTLDDNVQEILTELKAKERLTRLFIFERRYGTALLLCRYSSESKDTWNIPISESAKPELDAITPYPWTKVKVEIIDKDLSSPTYAYPMKYKISQGISGIMDLDVDHTRTIRAATRLDEHLYLGVSIVDLIADDAVGYRTFRSGVYKLWVRYGSGMPVINIPKASLAQLTAMEEEGHFDDISNRSYILTGKDVDSVDFKGVAGVSLNPTPTDNIGINNLSMASGVPSDILRGTQAGTLAGSQVDENQYFKRISSEQSLAEPTVRTLIDILISTGQVNFDGEYAIKWNATARIDAQDMARIEVMETTANEKKLKYMTINEIRAANKLDPLLEGGDDPPSQLPAMGRMFGALPAPPTADEAQSLPDPNYFTRKLKNIVDSYKHGIYTKKIAKEQGKAAIEDEFEILLNLSRDRVSSMLKRPIELPPEELQRLERWRDDYIKDFGGIIDDVERS